MHPSPRRYNLAYPDGPFPGGDRRPKGHGPEGPHLEGPCPEGQNKPSVMQNGPDPLLPNPSRISGPIPKTYHTEESTGVCH